jgi:hypothetical protein
MATLTKTIDFGATPVDGGTFVVNDAGFASQTYIEAFIMSADSTVDNDTQSHMQLAHSAQLACSAVSSNNVTLDIHLLVGLATGTFKVRFATST